MNLALHFYQSILLISMGGTGVLVLLGVHAKYELGFIVLYLMTVGFITLVNLGWLAMRFETKAFHFTIAQHFIVMAMACVNMIILLFLGDSTLTAIIVLRSIGFFAIMQTVTLNVRNLIRK